MPAGKWSKTMERKWRLDQQFGGKRTAARGRGQVLACIYHDGGPCISELVHGG
jgi:hypothetical protein